MRYPFMKAHSSRHFTRVFVSIFLLTFAGAALAQHGGRGCDNPRHGHYERDHYKGRDHYDYDRYDRDYRRDRGRYSRAYRPARQHRFEVPRHIKRHHYDDYRDYYYGSIYHREHDHYHRIYSFPVYERGHWTYRPHAYCKNAFFEVGIFTRFGRLRFGLDIRL